MLNKLTITITKYTWITFVTNLWPKFHGSLNNICRCPSYPSLPAYCQKNRVPGQCCPVIKCDVPGFGTLNPDSQLVPTPAPTKGMGVIRTPAPTGLVPIIQILPNNPQNVTGGQLPGGGYPIKSTQISGIRSKYWRYPEIDMDIHV